MKAATAEVLVKSIIPEAVRASKYIPAEGTHLTEAEAQACGEELERLFDEGKATASDIVDAASDPASAFHKHLTWDDAKAAHERRCTEARRVIRSINILVEDDRGKLQEVRAFPAVRVYDADPDVQEHQKSYTPIHVVMGDVDKCAQVMGEAKRMLMSWRARYASYRALFPTFSERFSPVFSFLDDIDEDVEAS